MTLHRVRSITIGVPDVARTADYYEEFGLDRTADGGLATSDGGEQLLLRHAPRRRLEELRIETDDRDDLDRIARRLDALDVPHTRGADEIVAVDGASEVRFAVTVAQRPVVPVVAAPAYNGPGAPARGPGRAPGVNRTGPVRPRKLGHVVIGSVDQARTQQVLVEGIGFAVSDVVRDRAAFLRCTTDHHNLLVQQAPISFFHHSSWEVDDVDEVGRGATAMLDADPARHVWGLGRHHIGSNFFWYLRDPVGNFSEYYADMDSIVEDQLWEPGVFDEARSALYQWGPPPPESFFLTEELAGLMAGQH